MHELTVALIFVAMVMAPCVFALTAGLDDAESK